MIFQHKTPLFLLAPMDDVTDTVFRRIVSDCAAPDLTMTEFVNVDGLCSPGRSKLLARLATTHDTTPVLAQLWGKQPDNFTIIARELATGLLGDEAYEALLTEQQPDQLDAQERLALIEHYSSEALNNKLLSPRFCGIDINFGCPDKAVVKNECCSALAQPHLRDQAVAIVQATQRGAQSSGQTLPVTIKTRLGFAEIDYSWHELLLSQQPTLLSVHVRTTKQMSKVPANWPAIEPIVALRNKIAPETKVILNGDVMSRQQGMQLIEQHGVDGIMIGRGLFQDPFAFAETSPWPDYTKQQRLALYRRHVELYFATWKEGERSMRPLNKFCKVYINDFPDAKELRHQCMEAPDRQSLLALLDAAQAEDR